MREEETEKYIDYISTLLEDSGAFAEFNPILNSDADVVANNLAVFTENMHKYEIFNKVIYSVLSLITIKILNEETNKLNNANIQLPQLSIFNFYLIKTIEFGKEVADKAKMDLENFLFYSFVLGRTRIIQMDESLVLRKVIGKEVIKPITKKFNKEYNKVYKAINKGV